MKKGFTLVELLAVIVIMSLAALITFSSISNMQKREELQAFEDYKKNLFIACETYINLENIDVSNEIEIALDTLVDLDYLSELPANPQLKKKEYGAKIKVRKDSVGVLVFDYINE